MNTALQSKIEKLRTDYAQVTGKPFNHFYCPILFKDENVELCKAHIINQAFQNAPRSWTVQRKDVDNFYGTIFEGDFTDIKYAKESLLDAAVTDKELAKRFNLSILLNDNPIEHFVANSTIPKDFTRLDFEKDGHIVPFVLKRPPQDVVAMIGQKWEIAVSKDIRIPAMVSLIKAAHLTLFRMLGYRYGLSAGSCFVGRQILGDFFENNRDRDKQEVLSNAIPFFREFAPMVRPLASKNLGLQGTITDGVCFLCGWNGSSAWAAIVFIKIGETMNAVMVPLLDSADKAAIFYGFIQSTNETVMATACRFQDGHWEIEEKPRKFIWPKTGILYP